MQAETLTLTDSVQNRILAYCLLYNTLYIVYSLLFFFTVKENMTIQWYATLLVSGAKLTWKYGS